MRAATVDAPAAARAAIAAGNYITIATVTVVTASEVSMFHGGGVSGGKGCSSSLRIWESWRALRRTLVLLGRLSSIEWLPGVNLPYYWLPAIMQYWLICAPAPVT